MYKQIPKNTKEEILLKIKQGEKVMNLSSQYGISHKTIYAWLQNQIKPEVTLMEWNKLKRENIDLKQIIGTMALEIGRGKKNKSYQIIN